MLIFVKLASNPPGLLWEEERRILNHEFIGKRDPGSEGEQTVLEWKEQKDMALHVHVPYSYTSKTVVAHS